MINNGKQVGTSSIKIKKRELLFRAVIEMDTK